MKKYHSSCTELSNILKTIGYITFTFMAIVIFFISVFYFSITGLSSSSFNPFNNEDPYEKILSTNENLLNIKLPSDNKKILVYYNGATNNSSNGIHYTVYKLDWNNLLEVKRSVQNNYNWQRRPSSNMKTIIRKTSSNILKIQDKSVQRNRIPINISNAYYFLRENTQNSKSNLRTSSGSYVLSVLDLNKNLLYIYEQTS